MTNKNNNKTEKKQKKRENKLLKSFLLIALLFVFVTYLVMQARPDLLENIYPNKTANTNPPETDEKLIQEAIDDGYSVGPEPPLYPSDIEKDDQVNDAEEDSELGVYVEPEEEAEEEIVNPYIEIIDVEAKAFDSSALKDKFNDYRIFISNANKLLEKYRDNKNYATELKIFKDHIHPTYINETIRLLESYNTLLENSSNNSVKEVKSDSFQKKLIAKFVKIKKLEPVDKDLLKVKSDIDGRLDTFTDYIYSQKLQDSLVK